MNIVKFLETMEEDVKRCKRTLNRISNYGVYTVFRDDSEQALAYEMVAKYGGILEGIPNVSDYELYYNNDDNFHKLFSLLYGRLFSCVSLGGKGIINTRVIKPGWVEYIDKDDKLLSVLCRHPELGRQFSSAEIQKIRKGSKITLSVVLNDGTTKRAEITITEFDEKMIKR